MPNTLTTALNLLKLADNTANWGTLTNATLSLLDALAALGSLAVAAKDVDVTTGASTSLFIKVSAGQFMKSDGTIVTYAGTASQAVTGSTTNYVYLTDSGTLTVNTTGFPAAATKRVQLATVTTDSTKVTAITDKRICWVSCG